MLVAADIDLTKGNLVRLAKCEKQQGVYDWAWLDEIINDALAQRVLLYWAAMTLGPLVLRCETAAVYALSILSYELQGLGSADSGSAKTA